MPPPANDDHAPLQRSPIGEADLQAYVDGALDEDGRSAVEGYLACNPDLAARVMTALHARRRTPAARQARRPRRRLVQAAAALAICLGSGALGWSVAATREAEGWREADGGLPPDYVEDAADSRQASVLRAAMTSQAETPILDAAEIRRAMRLRLPHLPRDWRIVDVQVYPTDDGPSLNLVVETPQRRRLDLFAIRAPDGVRAPELARRGKEIVAFWRRDNSAYVLGGDGSSQQLLSAATELSQNSSL